MLRRVDFRSVLLVHVSVVFLWGCAATIEGVKEDIKNVGVKSGLTSASERSGQANEADEPSVLVQIQTLLKAQGYYNGDISGDFTASTEAAIQDYQLDKGLRIDGRPTKKLLAALEAG